MSEIGNVGSQDITSMIAGQFASKQSDHPPLESKKRTTEFDADTIYSYVHKYKIEEVNLSNLQKLHEKELINVPFFQKLRKLFAPQMIKSKLMETLGIRKSYTGFHEYVKGEREDIPNAGLCNIAKNVGYNIMILPIPENISDAEYRNLCAYRDSFIFAIEAKIKEDNVPVTRAKAKDKGKDRFINTELLNGLAMDSTQILNELVPHNDSSEKIAADAIFDDGIGPLEFEEVNSMVNQMDVSIIPMDQSIGIVGGMGGMDDGMDSIYNSLSINMNGYKDTFEDFKKIDMGDDEFMFGEDEDSLPINMDQLNLNDLKK